MKRIRSEGDTIELTNPGPEDTVVGQVGMVSGYATVCNEGGVPAGRKAPYSVTGRFKATVVGGAGVAEGDDLTVDGNGDIVAAAEGDDVVARANDAVPAGETREIWIRLPAQ